MKKKVELDSPDRRDRGGKMNSPERKVKYNRRGKDETECSPVGCVVTNNRKGGILVFVSPIPSYQQPF